MKKALLATAIMALGALTLSGCNTVNTYSSESQNITDVDLANTARVTNIRKSLVSGDLLRVQVDVTNIDDDSEDFNYKFEWFDAQGNKLDSMFDSWQRLSVSGRETLTVTGTATSPKATDFKFKIIDSQ
jgi:uncharacterized protein YcfL